MQARVHRAATVDLMPLVLAVERVRPQRIGARHLVALDPAEHRLALGRLHLRLLQHEEPRFRRVAGGGRADEEVDAADGLHVFLRAGGLGHHLGLLHALHVGHLCEDEEASLRVQSKDMEGYGRVSERAWQCEAS